MSVLRRSLPSLTSLAAFESAARHQSFKQAAQDLNVTPAAISHQVKSLEENMNISLFTRYHRGVELTEPGALLFTAIQRGFDHIAETVHQLRLQSDQEAVTIEATTAMSSFWLTPRLSQFWAKYRDIPVSQNVTDQPGTSAPSDLHIFYGDPDIASGDCQILFRDRIAILAAPGFAERHAVQRLDDLHQCPVIHQTASDSRWTGWQSFCEELGYGGKLGFGHYVNNYMIALQAAQDGMGAILGWETLTRHLIENGSLVQMLPMKIDAPHAFYIATRKHAPTNAITLRNWLLKSVAPQG
jgi:DNA-binding transcriptional LysR family regulator